MVTFKDPADLVAFLKAARAAGVAQLDLAGPDGSHVKVALLPPEPAPTDPSPPDNPLFDGVNE